MRIFRLAKVAAAEIGEYMVAKVETAVAIVPDGNPPADSISQLDLPGLRRASLE